MAGVFQHHWHPGLLHHLRHRREQWLGEPYERKLELLGGNEFQNLNQPQDQL